VFYRAHPSARFYKERRYLLLEFPCLAPPAQLQHVVEIGAGCGSSILPVMRAQPQAQVTVCDVSATCLQQLQGAMQLLGLEPQLCSCFVADGTDPGLGGRLAACAADVALIMFTLSAVEPAGMLVMMQNAAASLRPGGLLCVRDHALYDMVQLRIPAEQVGG
jgi:predicted O-methyltransferase YrrM